MNHPFTPSTARHRPHGFTLIELMVTIAVMVILMSVAVPSFVSFRRNSELRGTANSFLAAMSAARAEAMKRGVKVYVVPLADNSTDWTTGWRVYADVDWDGAYTAGTDVLITEEPAIPSSVTVTTDTTTHVTSFTQSSGPYVAFGAAGFPAMRGADTGSPSGAIQFTVAASGESRRVALNLIGRMRVCQASEATCDPTQF